MKRLADALSGWRLALRLLWDTGAKPFGPPPVPPPLPDTEPTFDPKEVSDGKR